MITYIILEVPSYDVSIMGPKTLLKLLPLFYGSRVAVA